MKPPLTKAPPKHCSGASYTAYKNRRNTLSSQAAYGQQSHLRGPVSVLRTSVAAKYFQSSLNRLPTETYQQSPKFPVDAPARVILRLERLMGTSSIQPTDSAYMKTLREKLKLEEKGKWETRFAARKTREYERCRKLVVKGEADPLPGMEDMYDHPVFRVNRIMDRLSNFDAQLGKEFQLQLPPIRAVEPFEDYKRTGFHFWEHPGHYMKVKLEKEKVNANSTVSPKKSEPGLMFHSRQFDAHGKLLPPQEVPVVDSTKPTGVDRSFRPKSLKLEPVWSSKAKVVREDIEAAKKKYGINPEDIEKLWKAYDSPLIQMMDKEKETHGLIKVSKEVLGVLERERSFGNFAKF